LNKLIHAFLALVILYSFSFAQDGLPSQNYHNLVGKKVPKSLLNKMSIHLDEAPLGVALAYI